MLRFQRFQKNAAPIALAPPERSALSASVANVTLPKAPGVRSAEGLGVPMGSVRVRVESPMRRPEKNFFPPVKKSKSGKPPPTAIAGGLPIIHSAPIALAPPERSALNASVANVSPPIALAPPERSALNASVGWGALAPHRLDLDLHFRAGIRIGLLVVPVEKQAGLTL